MACNFKNEAIEQAEHLRKTLEAVIGEDVLMYQYDNVHNDNLKIVIYNCYNAEPLMVSSYVWYDLYLSLKAAEDAVTFSITAPNKD